ncbi:MAG: phosphonate lyase system protein PhnH [Peptococcaceae bacterium]|nr:phosphonate lyase system protein PhnH [Peptococcaceae bacterium]
MVQQTVKETGFNIVFDSQQVFRLLMDAMSRPGKINKLADYGFTRIPSGFNPYVLALLKTLSDNTVTFSIAGDRKEPWESYLEINTGAKLESVNQADFVVFQGPIFSQDILTIKRGTLEFPEDSATAIISVDSLGEKEDSILTAPASTFTMRGPGIKDFIILNIGGLDKRFGQALAEVNAIFPLGIDIIMVDVEGQLACIPRTTQVEVA